MAMSYEDIMAMIPAFPVHGNKFAAKLTFEQRCEVLAWRRRGIPKSVLAKIFNLHPRTIKEITSSATGRYYKNVRAEEARLGTEEFMRTYIREDTANRIYEILNAASNPARNARKSAGLHLIENAATSKPHRIFIEYKEDGEQGPGWYYQDFDGPNPEGWFHCGDESRTSSTKLLEMVKQELFD